MTDIQTHVVFPDGSEAVHTIASGSNARMLRTFDQPGAYHATVSASARIRTELCDLHEIAPLEGQFVSAAQAHPGETLAFYRVAAIPGRRAVVTVTSEDSIYVDAATIDADKYTTIDLPPAQEGSVVFSIPSGRLVQVYVSGVNCTVQVQWRLEIS